MIRRVLSVALVTAAAVAAVVLTGAHGGEGDARRYVVELDNAFGMVKGGDVRVAGVNAGHVIGIELDPETLKGLIEVEIDEAGFGSLREDAFCEARPQSPLGEYFLDCAPGTATNEIPPGGTVPVEQTASTIPPDLVQNVMRRPYRERFRLVLNEFGAGLAGRPEDLNDAIRRGVPALRQTARLLEVLADHDTVIRDLVGDADRVLARLSDNRRDVGRFVKEAGDTASASAERADDIATNFRKLPTFVRELRPTMAALEEVAVEQRPVLVDLSAAADDLERFFADSGEFAEAARPAIRRLARLAPTGRQAVRAARPQTQQLRRYARPTRDLAPNLRITLEDFSDQDRAVEPDPRSPGGKGFAGSQAILAYIFNQSLTNNAFDEIGHMVRAAPFSDKCSPYRDASGGRDPELADCRAWLGPNQPGVNQPDPSPGGGRDEAEGAAGSARSGQGARGGAEGSDAAGHDHSGDAQDEDHAGRENPTSRLRAVNRLLDDLLGRDAPAGPRGPAAPLTPLLDYLLAP